MDRIRIRGGRPLAGEIRIGGAKNAALPLMAAGLLTDEPLTLSNVPRLADIEHHGRPAAPSTASPSTSARQDGRDAVAIGGADRQHRRRPTTSCARCAPRCWCWGRCWRACGEARVSLPGGCAIGTRPVDLHLKGLEQLGAEIELERRLYRTPARRAA